ncbi:MAG: NHL repeat-containing protein, partial [bacterium]
MMKLRCCAVLKHRKSLTLTRCVSREWPRLGAISKNLLPLLVVIVSFLLAHFASARGQGGLSEVKHVMRITDGLASPLRIAIDERDDVYVTDAIGGRISRYDSAGNFLGQSIAGHSPLAITVTPQHQLYVGDRISGELLLLNAEGQFLKKIADGFGLPSSAVIDDENRLYVVDSKKKSVHIFDANGNPLSSFGESILFFPTGIAFDQRNQRILVAEHGGLNYTDTVHL